MVVVIGPVVGAGAYGTVGMRRHDALLGVELLPRRFPGWWYYPQVRDSALVGSAIGVHLRWIAVRRFRLVLGTPRFCLFD